ncbi:MAG: helix-turn-helix domain-containing protein [Rhodospirillales bacterium]|jgi:putative transcriptional regulator
MKKREFSKLMEGLDNAIAFAEGDTARAKKVHTVTVPAVDPRATRESLNLTRAEFAHRFYLKTRTLQNWEQGARVPDDAARLYLLLVQHNPEMVRSTLEPLLGDETAALQVPAHIAARAIKQGHTTRTIRNRPASGGSRTSAKAGRRRVRA